MIASLPYGLMTFAKEYAIDRIDLLKIDVQGHEADVLRGAEGLISAGRVGVILFELNWANDSSVSALRARAFVYLNDTATGFPTRKRTEMVSIWRLDVRLE